MVATIVGLITIAVFGALVYGSKRFMQSVLKREVTVVDALFFTGFGIAVIAIVFSIANAIGEQVLNLF